MNEKSDAQLLRHYAECGTEAAFREIVMRHTDFVYSAARRQVDSADLAADIAQGVFVDLARKAKSLCGRLTTEASLAGWLHRATRFASLNYLRDIRRQRTNEKQAMEQLFTNSEPSANWEQIRPMLDEALDSLGDEDREALLLRYFKNRDFRAVGLALGVSDDAAQKRVSRAVEKLREFFSKRNVTIGASGLVVLISANAVQSAPVGLAAAISTAAIVTGTTVSTSTAIAATKTIVMTTLQKTIIGAVIVSAVGTGIFEAHQASRLREQIQTLQQQQAPLAEQIQELQRERDDATNQLAGLLSENAQLQSNQNETELLKLRGQVSQNQTTVMELAKAKTSAEQQSRAMHSIFTNAAAIGISTSEKFAKKNALTKLARMTEILHLTADQEKAIGEIMMRDIQDHSQLALNALTGQLTTQQAEAMAQSATNEESEIRSLLTPDQLVAYPEYQQAEAVAAAKDSANAELTTMAAEMELSPEQQKEVRSALYQYNLNQASSTVTKDAIAQARTSGDFADVINLQIATQQKSLANKLKLLGGILTPEQLQTYKQKETEMIDQQAQAMKMLVPQTNSKTTQ